MQALRYLKVSNKLELMEIPVPKITQPDDVLIKVTFSGICATDLRIIQGQYPSNENFVTLGHEICGTVADFGSNVENLKSGDEVAVDPNKECDYCLHTRQRNLCSSSGIQSALGIWKDGGCAEYVLVSADQVHKIPESVSLEQAALTEPISCVVHGWDILSPITVGAHILIIGAGIIGNLWVAMLRLHDHSNVTISEFNSTRLDMLKKLDTGYNLVTPKELKEKAKLNPDYLFDVIVDCSGSPRATEDTINLLKEGGKLCCFGEASPQAEIRIRIFDDYMKELKLYGAFTNPSTFSKAVGFLSIMGDKYLNYETLGIKIFSLKDYQEAIEMLQTWEISKAIFKC